MNMIQNYSINFQGGKNSTTKKLMNLGKIKDIYTAKSVKPGSIPPDYSLYHNEVALQKQLLYFDKYLEQYPNDIEVRAERAKVKEMLKGYIYKPNKYRAAEIIKEFESTLDNGEKPSIDDMVRLKRITNAKDLPNDLKQKAELLLKRVSE